MANIKSKIKSARKSILLKKRNSAVKSEIKTLIRKTLAKAEDKNVDKKSILLDFSEVQKKLAKAAKKGILHKNNAALKTSKFAIAINKLMQQRNQTD